MTDNKQLKVLDLFCGRGGWSKPFIEDGDEVWGIDIKNFDYPGKLIQSDIRELDGYGFSDMDFFIGSPPCGDVSKAKENRRNPEVTLELIGQFFRLCAEAGPKYWAFENVSQLEKFYHAKPAWRFKMGAQAERSLWANFDIPLANEFRFPHRILDTTRGRYYAKRHGVKALPGSKFAEIPYPIARFIADTVRRHLCHGRC